MRAVARLAAGVVPRVRTQFSIHCMMSSNASPLPRDDDGWRAVLSRKQFAVLREKATEPAGYSEGTAGELENRLKAEHGTKYPSVGAYECVGCGSPLYYASTKFNSGCGWPAFYDGVPGAIDEVRDDDGVRCEIVCARCKGHLGHVFKGEGTPRHPDHPDKHPTSTLGIALRRLTIRADARAQAGCDRFPEPDGCAALCERHRPAVHTHGPAARGR